MQEKTKVKRTGRSTEKRGYVKLTRRGMTDAQVQLADHFNLWVGKGDYKYVHEHRLVAVEKFGNLPRSIRIIWHDENKQNNHPDNIGIRQRNAKEIKSTELYPYNKDTSVATAFVNAVFWRDMYYSLKKATEPGYPERAMPPQWDGQPHLADN